MIRICSAIVDKCMREGRWAVTFLLTEDIKHDEGSAFGVAVKPFGDSYNSPLMYMLRSYNGELCG